MKLFILLFTVVFSVQAEDRLPWNRIVLAGGSHLMMGFVPPKLKRADTLNIFIEGDGKPSVALKLAQDIGGNSVYIGRPCQYMMGSSMNTCTKALWTSARYSQSVVDSMNRAITTMKVRYQAKKLRLIGFSGSGAIATIIATKRNDLGLLVTVAGNLDHKRWIMCKAILLWELTIPVAGVSH